MNRLIAQNTSSGLIKWHVVVREYFKEAHSSTKATRQSAFIISQRRQVVGGYVTIVADVVFAQPPVGVAALIGAREYRENVIFRHSQLIAVGGGVIVCCDAGLHSDVLECLLLGWCLEYWKWSYLGTEELFRGGVVLFL